MPHLDAESMVPAYGGGDVGRLSPQQCDENLWGHERTIHKARHPLPLAPPLHLLCVFLSVSVRLAVPFALCLYQLPTCVRLTQDATTNGTPRRTVFRREWRCEEYRQHILYRHFLHFSARHLLLSRSTSMHPTGGQGSGGGGVPSSGSGRQLSAARPHSGGGGGHAKRKASLLRRTENQEAQDVDEDANERLACAVAAARETSRPPPRLLNHES